MSMGLATARNALVRGDELALCGEPDRTWRELDRRTNRLANLLRERFGVRPGDRVALFTHNRPEVVEVLVACHKAAAVYVGLNFRMSTADLEGVFENAEPAVLIGEAEYAEQARELTTRSAIAYVDLDDTGPDGFEPLLRSASDQPPVTLHAVRPSDLACIVYTSGTTGRPKGVVFDHAAMLQHGAVAALEYGIGPGCRYLIQIPHNSSVNITMAPCLMTGAALAFADNRGFTPERFAATVAARHVTHTFLVPTQLVRILDQLPAGDSRLASIDTLGYGSSPIAPDRLGQLVERYGPVFIQLYGMAEVASIATLLRKQDHVLALDDRPELLRSAGRASLGLDVVVAGADGTGVPVGERGEVIFRGPHVMRGYHRDPERTDAVLVDGWMHSGDVGRFDEDGYLYVVDRIKDLIIRGGQNLAPTDVEHVLSRHPDVLEAAVVGAPDPEWGERVVAVVALRDGGRAGPGDLARFVADSELPTIARPEEVRLVDSLPKNAVGKIDKRAVRSLFWGGERQV